MKLLCVAAAVALIQSEVPWFFGGASLLDNAKDVSDVSSCRWPSLGSVCPRSSHNLTACALRNSPLCICGKADNYEKRGLQAPPGPPPGPSPGGPPPGQKSKSVSHDSISCAISCACAEEGLSFYISQSHDTSSSTVHSARTTSAMSGQVFAWTPMAILSKLCLLLH